MTTNWQQPPGGAPPSGQNNQSQNAGKGKRFAVVGVLLVVIAGLAAGAGLFMANRDSDTAADDARYVLTETVASDPVFEPRDARGADPFFPLEVQLVAFQEEQEEGVRQQAEEILEGAEPGQEVEVPAFDVAALDEAVKTGLYGGTEENTCDPERLISFLYANPDLGEAWAKVQGIEFVEIADYIRGLDVRILAEDTNVLNHGFNPDNGAPYEIDTILAAGTAVLVDENGDIRTRCYCGNPIKPKPPEHMPPRCVVWIEHIYVQPAGDERRANAVRDVLLTGRETTVGGALWLEVKWGNANDQTGWVRSDNLRKHYCPPEQIEWQCPGPERVPVWANPDTTDQVGWHSGTVRTSTGETDIFGPVQPVGAPNPTVVNDFMLIRFTQANNAQNSAWVALDDLQQDEENCFRVPVCIETDGPVWARGGGAIIDAGGVMQVEFTGRFVTEVGFLTEVRLVEQGGTAGWTSIFYTALEDAECDAPGYECVTDYGELGAIVYQDSTGNDHIGHVYNATVTRLGPEQDGRVLVEMATPGGPEGWIDEERFTADIAKCRPYYECYVTTVAAYAEFPTEGAMIGAQSASIIGVVGKRAHTNGADPTYTRIEVAGSRYWINELNLLPASSEECDPTTEVDCPTYGWNDERDELPPRSEDIAALTSSDRTSAVIAIDDPTNNDRPTITECCVSALFETPDTSTPVMGQLVPVQVTVIGAVVVDNGGGDEVWYLTDTGDYFNEMHVTFGDCIAECPQPTLVPPLGDRVEQELASELYAVVVEPRQYDPEPQDDGDCCIAGASTGIQSGIDADGEFPRFVEVVSGPHTPAPGWYLTADGDWFAAIQVVGASICEHVECPNPMVPGIYDQYELQRDTENTVALAFVYPGDTAECCAQGNTHGGPSFADDSGAPLTEPTSVIVIGIDGDWYQVIVQDFVTWIHVSQFLDLEECDGGGDLPCDNLQGAIATVAQEFRSTVDCCISGIVRFENPADSDPGETSLLVDPAEFGEFVGVLEFEGQTWYEFDTAGYGTVWALASNLVNGMACNPEVECPGNSIVGQTIVDDFENGPFNIYMCCVSMLSATGGPIFEVVTLTGDTMEEFGVVSYGTDDGEFIVETDFVFGDDCRQTCPDGQTIVENLQDCPPPAIRCPNGQEVDSLNDCPTPIPPRVTCADGSTAPTANECPTPTPPPVTCPDGSTAPARGACPDPVVTCPDGSTVPASQGCPDPVVTCPDGSTVPASQGCPDPVVTCPDGSGAVTLDDCPVACQDRDQDQICDAQDNCPDTRNFNQNNSDGDGVGDACDNCVFVTNGFQDDSDGDGTGDLCEVPDCPDRLLSNGECCPTESVADGSQCFCPAGQQVQPGGTCPPPCPVGTIASGTLCLCADQSEPVPGAGCTKQCPNGDRVPEAQNCPPVIEFEPICPTDRLRGDGVCCPEGQVAFLSNNVTEVFWECVYPLF